MAKDYRGDSKNIIVGAASIFIKADGPVDPAGEEQLPDFEEGTSYRDTLNADKLEGAIEGSEYPSAPWRNVGYTQNGLELTITPDFGEVEVDQLLDSAKIFKQGMQVTLNTTFAEATLENLLYAIAASPNDLNEGLHSGGPYGLPTTYSGIRDGRFEGDPVGEGIGVRMGQFAPSEGDPLADGVNDPAGAAGLGVIGDGSGHYVSANNPSSASSQDAIDVLDITSGKLGECPIERGIAAVGPGTGDCAVGDEIERIYLAFRAMSMDAVTISVSRDAASTFDVTFRLLPAANGSYGRVIDRTFTTSTAVRAPGSVRPAVTLPASD